MQRLVRLDALDHQFIQRILHAAAGNFPIVSPGDQLGDHGVVEWRYGVAAVQVRVYPYTVTARRMEVLDLARAGYKGLRVFGVDTAFQRVAGNLDLVLGVLQGQATGNAQLLANDIDTGHHL